jgi:hypothetical protein
LNEVNVDVITVDKAWDLGAPFHFSAQETNVYKHRYDKKLVVQEVVSLSGDGEIPLKIVGG